MCINALILGIVLGQFLFMISSHPGLAMQTSLTAEDAARFFPKTMGKISAGSASKAEIADGSVTTLVTRDIRPRP